MKKFISLLLSVSLICSCSQTEGQIIGTDIPANIDSPSPFILVLGKINNIEKDEKSILENGFEFSYITIDILNIIYSTLPDTYEDNKIKMLFSANLESHLFTISYPYYDYCEEVPSLESCTQSEVELYKELSYNDTDHPLIKKDIQFVNQELVKNTLMLFYILPGFKPSEFNSFDSNGETQYPEFKIYEEYKVKPKYTKYFGGHAEFLVLEGRDWSYDLNLDFRSQTSPKVLSRITSIIEALDRKIELSK